MIEGSRADITGAPRRGEDGDEICRCPVEAAVPAETCDPGRAAAG